MRGVNCVPQEGSMRKQNIFILVSVLETHTKTRNFDYVKPTWIMMPMPMLSCQVNDTSIWRRMDTFLKVPFELHSKKKYFPNPKYICYLVLELEGKIGVMGAQPALGTAQSLPHSPLSQWDGADNWKKKKQQHKNSLINKI